MDCISVYNIQYLHTVVMLLSPPIDRYLFDLPLSMVLQCNTKTRLRLANKISVIPFHLKSLTQ